MVELFAEEAACKIFCILKAGKLEAEILKLLIEFQLNMLSFLPVQHSELFYK